jgi:hypothetical protein
MEGLVQKLMIDLNSTRVLGDKTVASWTTSNLMVVWPPLTVSLPRTVTSVIRAPSARGPATVKV